MLRRDPLGVCAGIAPWNYPLNMATWKFGPALAAGNTFVLKPSELTPLTALKLAELAADILPPGVFNVVCGQGETAGDALVAPPRRGHGVAHGRRRRPASSSPATAADTLKRVHLELGGKAPVVVFDDADLEPGRQHAGRERATTTPARTAPPPCRVVAGPGIYDDLVPGLADAASALARRRPDRRGDRGGPGRLRRPSGSGSPAWSTGLGRRPAPRS